MGRRLAEVVGGTLELAECLSPPLCGPGSAGHGACQGQRSWESSLVSVACRGLSV